MWSKFKEIRNRIFENEEKDKKKNKKEDKKEDDDIVSYEKYKDKDLPKIRKDALKKYEEERERLNEIEIQKKKNNKLVLENMDPENECIQAGLEVFDMIKKRFPNYVEEHIKNVEIGKEYDTTEEFFSLDEFPKENRCDSELIKDVVLKKLNNFQCENGECKSLGNLRYAYRHRYRHTGMFSDFDSYNNVMKHRFYANWDD